MECCLLDNHWQQNAISVLQTRCRVEAEMRLFARRASSAAMPPMRTEAIRSRGTPMAALTAM